jgi:hypothetical protein
MRQKVKKGPLCIGWGKNALMMSKHFLMHPCYSLSTWKNAAASAPLVHNFFFLVVVWRHHPQEAAGGGVGEGESHLRSSSSIERSCTYNNSTQNVKL